jgi:cytochrome c2/cytochrome b561
MNQKTYGRSSVIAGWLVALLYFSHQQLTVFLARSDRFGPLREEFRGWHYLLGTLVFAAVVWRLVAWRRDGAVAPAPGVSPALHNWGRWLALVAYCTILAAPFIGIIYAWSDALTIHLGPFFALPSLMERNRSVWMFTGYFHSGLGFMFLVISVVSLLTAGWGLLRHGKGLLAIFPPGFGVQILAGVASTVYAFSTFRSPEPGPRALAIFAGICAAVWVVAWLIHRNRADKPGGELGTLARIAAPVAAISLLGLGAYGPHALFKVTPWPMGETIEGPKGVTSHLDIADHPAARIAPTPPTAFENQVKAETYKWCRFCHTVEKNGPHLVGPNLYHIFGQRAGTAPNFAYTTALSNAGRKGLVWTDERIAWFIADPQKHLPGTSMIVSSGPIPDPEVQKSVVNLLRRDTMGDVPPAAKQP